MVPCAETRTGRMGYSIGKVVLQAQEVVLRKLAFPRQLQLHGLFPCHPFPLHAADGVEHEINKQKKSAYGITTD